jgi:AraC family transcriptional regulator, L-rhamnose operon regulatory protein RhaS
VFDETLASSKNTVQIFLKRLPHALARLDSREHGDGRKLSRTQFSQYFQALINTTPVRYLQSMRLEAARN